VAANSGIQGAHRSEHGIEAGAEESERHRKNESISIDAREFGPL
jgi:hypothetical protein